MDNLGISELGNTEKMNSYEIKPLVMKDLLHENKSYLAGFHVVDAEMREYALHNLIMDLIAELPDFEARTFVIQLRNNLDSLITKNNLSVDLYD